MKMEIKQKSFQTLTKDLDQKGRVLIAVNAFDNVDSDGDISKPGSFKKTLKENFNKVRWFLNHNTSLLLGVPIKGMEANGQLQMEAQFNLQKEIARDTYEDYKLYADYGKSLEHSVGVQAIKYDIDQQEQIRTITEWKLWEFSTLTHWGANDKTPLLGIKNKKELLETMSNNANYSDIRKKAVENIWESLFILEPSNQTLDQKADMDELCKLIDLNIFKI